jgi:hypothetical protein
VSHCADRIVRINRIQDHFRDARSFDFGLVVSLYDLVLRMMSGCQTAHPSRNRPVMRNSQESAPRSVSSELLPDTVSVSLTAIISIARREQQRAHHLFGWRLGIGRNRSVTST